MHEWALASSIIETLKTLSEKHNSKIVKARIVLGELQSIDEGILKYALETLKKDMGLRDTEFEFIVEEAEFKCRRCSHTWKLGDVKKDLEEDVKESIHFVPEVVHSFLRCPKCGSRDFEVIKGRGLYIESIVVKRK